MGNSPGKKKIEPYEKTLDELFIKISDRKGHILRNDLKRAWASQIDEDLYNDFEVYLFRSNQNEINSQTFKNFFSEVCKGNSEQKIDVLFKLLGDSNKITQGKLLKFIMSILNSILIIQKSKSQKKYDSWSNRTEQLNTTESLKEYGMYFLDRMEKNDGYIKEDLNFLLCHIDFFLQMIFCCLYDTEEKSFYKNVLPKWKYTPFDSGKTLEQFSVLNLFYIMFLNLQLPIDYQNQWRPLFSSAVDGESFSRLCGQIINQGPTIILIKDKKGYIFGGFAPSSWSLGPSFFGDSRSFLFTLYPRMNLFVASNFNTNYQYINVGQQTMPNGMGMGGKLEYLGLWIDADFGRGCCNESCTTYRDYKMMSGSKDFEISHLEIWGVGLPPPTPFELGERSILDANLETKAILEMAGKTAYSEGLRENTED